MNHSNPILQVDKLAVAIKHHELLQALSFSVAKGEILGVIGPNGAGKTTLLKCIAGDIKSNTGSININAVDFRHWNKRQLACCLASLPQQSTLNFPFTVEEVVGMSRLPHQSGRDCDRDIVTAVMDTLDVLSLRDRSYTQLSGGEKQRVQLARVIAQLFPITNDSPKILLLDEPCNGLDLKHQKSLAGYLQILSQQGVTIIVATHDLNWTLSIGNKILALKNGRLETIGKVSDVVNDTVLEKVFDVPIKVSKNSRAQPVMVSLL